MRIRHLLITAIVLAFLLVATRLALLQVRMAQSDGLDRAQLHVDEISRDAASLLVLSQDYLLHASPRAARQWRAVHAELANRLTVAADPPPGMRAELTALAEVAQGLPTLFEAVRSIPGGVERDEAALVRRDMLASHLVAQTRRISDGAYDLSAELGSARRAADRVDRTVTQTTVALFAALVLFIAWLVHRRVLRPMAQMESAAQAVRAGDMSARSDYRSKDEFGRLSGTFDQMTDALQQRTAGLEAARRDMQAVLDAVPSEIAYWDRSLHNRFVNRAYPAWFGIDPQALAGAHMSILGEVYDKSLPYLEAVLRGEPQSFERRFQRADGSAPRYAMTHYLPDIVDGELRGFYCCMHDITAAKLTEQQLRASEAFLDRVGRVAGVGGWTLDIESGAVGWTSETCRLLDMPAGHVPTLEEVIGYYAPEARPVIRAAIDEGMADGTGWDMELPLVTATGRRIWARVIGEVEMERGRPKRLVGAFQDVSARRTLESGRQRAEALIQQAHDRFSIAADSAMIGVWEYELASGRLTWDDRMFRLYRRERSADSQPYALWAENIHPDDRAGSEAALQAAIAGGPDFEPEFRIRWPDGEVRHLKANARVVRDDAGVALRMTGVNIDITERKRAELDLQATSALLGSVLDSASEVSIIATDPQLNITVFNAGAERLLGYPSAEVVGRMTPIVIHDLGEVEARGRELTEQLGRPVEGGAVFTEPSTLQQPREWTYVRKDGGRVAVSLVVTAMHADDGTLIGYLGIAHDVTQRRAYEESLRSAMHEARHASLAKSQFLANMSHEIRTPMNAVIGLSYLMGQTSLDDTQANYLAKIRLASKSLLALINDILDLSKVEAGELTIERAPFKLHHLLKDLGDVMGVHAQAKSITLEIDAPDPLPAVLDGDAMRLSQILTNLLANAIKFTETGGVKLVVRQMAAVEADGTHVRLRFAVQDSGIGIAPDVQARLFMPFAQADASMTRRFGGTGLGLSIVKRLATLMGGSASMHSTLGAGSEFAVELPFALAAPQAQLPAPAAVLRPGERALPGVRVLVADDSDINLEVARRILELEGAHVTLASNGQEACDRLRAAPQDFDLVLMDVQMPVLDGYEATRCIRSEPGLARLPILALTAGALMSERQRAAEAGMNDFISKPFDPPALILTVRRHVPPERLQAATAAQVSPSALAAAAAGRDAGWPRIEGIDAADASTRLGGDLTLFKGMLKRLLAEFSGIGAALPTLDEAALPALAAHVHKLRGGAGSLGMRAVHRIASEAEAACRAGHVAEAHRQVLQLAAHLQALRDRTAGWLQDTAALAALADAPSADALPADPRLLVELAQLLREQNLSALDRCSDSAAPLRQLLGPARYEVVREHIESLQFEAALAALASSPAALAV